MLIYFDLSVDIALGIMLKFLGVICDLFHNKFKIIFFKKSKKFIKFLIKRAIMKIKDVVRILDAEILCGEEYLEQKIIEFAACDLLSDILAYSKEGYLLLTGLTSPQVIRTAELTGSIGILFVRGKLPPQEIIGLAKSHGIPLLKTDKLMFASCKRIVEELMKEKKK